MPYISTRTYSAFWCGSVKVVGAKKPEDSLLCACDMDTLTDGERLKVLRLHAGLTIRQPKRDRKRLSCMLFSGSSISVSSSGSVR